MSFYLPNDLLKEQNKIFEDFMALPDEDADWDDFFSQRASDNLKTFFEERQKKEEVLYANGIIV